MLRSQFQIFLFIRYFYLHYSLTKYTFHLNSINIIIKNLSNELIAIRNQSQLTNSSTFVDIDFNGKFKKLQLSIYEACKDQRKEKEVGILLIIDILYQKTLHKIQKRKNSQDKNRLDQRQYANHVVLKEEKELNKVKTINKQYLKQIFICITAPTDSKRNYIYKQDQDVDAYKNTFNLQNSQKNQDYHKSLVMEAQNVSDKEIFASIEQLSAQRNKRQKNKSDYFWKLDQNKHNSFQIITIPIEKLFCLNLSSKMLSNNYKEVDQAVKRIIELIESRQYDDQIRQVYDVLLKWVLVKLWSRQQMMVRVVELVAPILRVLKRKKVGLTEFEVELVTVIIRQYLISALSFEFRKTIFNIVNRLIAVSSLNKVRLQMEKHQLDVSYVKAHIKDNIQLQILYKDVLRELIKNQITKYLNYQDNFQPIKWNFNRVQPQLIKSNSKSRQDLSNSINAITNYLSIQDLDISAYPFYPLPENTLFEEQINKLFPPKRNLVCNFMDFLKNPTSADCLFLNSKCMFGSILKSISATILDRNEYHPRLLEAYINLLHNCIECPFVIPYLDDEMLRYAISFILKQLLYQSQYKEEIFEKNYPPNISCHNDIFVKALNRVMLRLLQNGKPEKIVSTLLEIWVIQQTIYPVPNKTINLIISCLSRVSSEICNEQNLDSGKLFFMLSVQYLDSINYKTQLKNLDIASKYKRKEIIDEDYAVNQMKNIIVSIYKCIDYRIHLIYEKALAELQVLDRVISSFIDFIRYQNPNIRPLNKCNTIVFLPNNSTQTQIQEDLLEPQTPKKDP